MIFYLFRHGDTYCSKYGVPYGKQIESAEIIHDGVSQAKEIAAKLDKEKVGIIYLSPIKRCVQTVEIIKKEVPAIEVVFSQRLEEEKVSRGLENLEDLTQRIKAFLDEIKTVESEKVGVCSHGWPLAVIIAILKKRNILKFDLSNYPKCGELVVIDTE